MTQTESKQEVTKMTDKRVLSAQKLCIWALIYLFVMYKFFRQQYIARSISFFDKIAIFCLQRNIFILIRAFEIIDPLTEHSLFFFSSFNGKCVVSY